MKLLLGLVALPLLAQSAIQDKEQALGNQVAAEIRAQSKPFGNAAVDAYVQRMGARLAPNDRFEVIVADAAEPIALPGGTIFVPAAFLLSVQNEAEFAGMLAHSIGHIELRHGFRTGKGAEGTVPIVFIGGWMNAHGTLVPLAFREVQHKWEMEADTFALDLAGRAGYNPAALRSYLQRTQPSDEQRLANVSQAPALPSVSSDEFLRAREAVRTALDQPKQRTAPTLGPR